MRFPHEIRIKRLILYTGKSPYRKTNVSEKSNYKHVCTIFSSVKSIETRSLNKKVFELCLLHTHINNALIPSKANNKYISNHVYHI